MEEIQKTKTFSATPFTHTLGNSNIHNNFHTLSIGFRTLICGFEMFSLHPSHRPWNGETSEATLIRLPQKSKKWFHISKPQKAKEISVFAVTYTFSKWVALIAPYSRSKDWDPFWFNMLNPRMIFLRKEYARMKNVPIKLPNQLLLRYFRNCWSWQKNWNFSPPPTTRSATSSDNSPSESRCQ